MIENSAAGLVMMVGEVTVTVTGEDRHQPALDPYRIGAGGQRRVAVELAWCTVRAGRHRGERVIEVRLDGRRVGELTHLMSERYGPLVRQVAAGGGRPGCEAVVQRGGKGLEITLRLPRAADTAAPAFVMAPAAPSVLAQPKKRGLTVAWVAVAAVAVIMIFAAVVGNAPAPATDTAGDVATTDPVPMTSEPATTTTTVMPAPVAPKPKPRVVRPKPPPAPPVQPEPASTCDPNYTGCVPVASDVDCAGGSGNGPAYVAGPVDVIGDDVYDLDRDGDGVACE